jgi:hypothetical protein
MRRELYDEMVRRHQARNSPYLRDGKLVALPLQGDSPRDRRNTSWPGYHTDFYQVDVRH